MTRGIPDSRAASSAFTVPSTLTREARSGSASPTAPRTNAKWTMASTCSAADHGDHLAERLHVAPHEPEPLAVPAERGDARLRQRHVEQHHALAAAQQFLGECGADESGPPGDESRHQSSIAFTGPPSR